MHEPSPHGLVAETLDLAPVADAGALLAVGGREDRIAARRREVAAQAGGAAGGQLGLAADGDVRAAGRRRRGADHHRPPAELEGLARPGRLAGLDALLHQLAP